MSEAAVSLDGKRAIVIGGSSGIGFAVAALAQELGHKALEEALGWDRLKDAGDGL
ncbi:MAG: hypothetical protein ACREPU_05705 [Rhodanobacteraceae bacterium]